MAVRFVFHPGYDFNRRLPLVKNVHGFVLDKPSQIRRRLIADGVATPDSFERPTQVGERELAAIHSPSVLAGLRRAKSIAAAAELAALAYLPAFISRHLVVKPQLRACGGTAMALAHAARGDWAFNLSGGFHHARPDLSHGFCLVNDVAWAVHKLRASGGEQPILVLDLDLHQGDGNIAAFADDSTVFTASLHQRDAFPFPKLSGDLDVALEGHGITDDVYLDAVDALLSAITDRFDPAIVIYVAGTDPFKEDAIGGFDVSADGLLERDRRVGQFVLGANASLVALPAGGYSPRAPELSAAGFAALAALAP